MDPQTNRRERLARVQSVVEVQSGVLARRQLRAAGWSDRQIAHEVDFERWQRPTAGVLVTNTGMLTEYSVSGSASCTPATEPCCPT